MKFQIQCTDKQGCGHFLYFDSEVENKEEAACQTANDDLVKRRQSDSENSTWRIFHTPFKPHKTLKVVEYDNEKKQVKRGGIKFKLSLSFFEAKTIHGNKIREEWYEHSN